MEGYRKLKEALIEGGLSHVRIGMKGIFKSSFYKVREITSVRPLTAEERESEKAAKEAEAHRAEQEAAAPQKGKKKPAEAAVTVDSSLSFRSPNHDKFVPHCVSIRTSPLDTISDLIDFFRYAHSQGDDNYF